MEPSLHDNQRVLVQKWDKTFAKLKGEDYIPERFDVIALKPSDDKTHVMKRVIGLPGDRVIVQGGVVFVINSAHPEGYIVDKDAPPGVVDANEKTEGNISLILGKDEVFVLGDNRQASEDSRYFGPVLTEAIAGKLWSRIGLF